MLLIILSGCSKKTGIDLGEFGLVAGTVTHDGNSVKEGMITFHSPSSGQVATAPVREGKYAMFLQGKRGLPLGDYVVSVRPPLARSQEHFRRQTANPGNANANRYPDIPEKYRYESSSGLTATVVSGKNNFDFDLAE